MPPVVHVTSYGRDALDRLSQVVGEAKADDPMAPVTILLPNNIAGIVARRHLAAGLPGRGPGVAGLYLSTLPRLAEQLASATLHPRRPAAGAVTAAAWRAALEEAPGCFAQGQGPPGHDPRLGCCPPHVARPLPRGPRAGATRHHAQPRPGSTARGRVRGRLADGWYDATDVLHTATSLLTAHPERTSELGTIVLYLPQSLSQAEAGFARALVPNGLTAVVGMTGVERADRAVRRSLERLGITDVGPDAEASVGDPGAACVGRRRRGPLRGSRGRGHRRGRHPGAPGRCPLRRHPALRTAAARAPRLERSGDQRPGDARRAGAGDRPRLPRHPQSLGGRSSPRLDLHRSRRGADQRLGRGAPSRSPDGNGSPVLPESSAARTGRRKLDHYAATQQRSWTSRSERRIRSPHAWTPPAASWITPRPSRVSSPDSGTGSRTGAAKETGRTSAHGPSRLFHDLYGEPGDLGRLPVEEQYAAAVVEGILRSLAGLATFESEAELASLVDVLALELESALPRVGRFGEGVFVGPVSAAVGMDLDAVFVVGLAEDGFPGRLHEDALLSEAFREATAGELDRLRDRLDAKHRHLLAAFAAATAGHGELSPRRPASQHRAAAQSLPAAHPARDHRQ